MPKTKTEMTVGQKLHFYRSRLGCTQTEIEQRAGLSSGEVTKIEKDQQVPRLPTLMKLATALELNNYETAYFLGVNLYKERSERQSGKDK